MCAPTPTRQPTALTDLEKRRRLPKNGLKNTLKWPFDKKESEAIILSLERSKSPLKLALERDDVSVY